MNDTIHWAAGDAQHRREAESIADRQVNAQHSSRGVSKDMLDTFWLSKRKHKQFANTKVGLRALIRWVREAEVSLVVFEATIARQAMQGIDERGHLPPVAGNQPCRA